VALWAETQPMDVLVFHPLIRAEQEDDFYVVATGKLTRFRLKTSRDDPVTCSSRHAPGSSVYHDSFGRLSLLLKLDTLRTEDRARSIHSYSDRKSVPQRLLLLR